MLRMEETHHVFQHDGFRPDLGDHIDGLHELVAFVVLSLARSGEGFEITPGQWGDMRAAPALIGSLPPALFMAADMAYDSDALRRFLAGRGTIPVIPNNPTRKRLHPFNAKAYRQHNVIE